MSLDVTIIVPLVPIGKGRPRFGRTRTGITVAYTPEKTRTWEAAFRELVAAHLPATPIEGPVAVDVDAVLARPASLCRRKDPGGLMWAPQKPDLDNVLKSVLDGLARHLRDDKQVVRTCVTKLYAEKDGLPRTVVRVRELAGELAVGGVL